MSNNATNEEAEEFKIMLRCSDGVSIDAKPFAKESIIIRNGYQLQILDKLEFEGPSDILHKVREFCEGRAKIKNDPPANDDDDILVQQKLNAFDSEFLKRYQTHAIQLMIVAFFLDIKSLKDLLMIDVDRMLTKMTSDEIYDIFHVNLREYNYYKFERMVYVLDGYPRSFE